MVTYGDASQQKLDTCRYLYGRTPSRGGIQRPAYSPRIVLENLGYNVAGIARYYDPLYYYDCFVIVSSTGNVYTVPLFGGGWTYDPYSHRQHSLMQMAAPTQRLNAGITANQVHNAGSGVSFLQYKRELFIFNNAGGVSSRFYVTDPSMLAGPGLYRTVDLGIPSQGAPTVNPTGAGGSLVNGTVYYYCTTEIDEFGRESSPSNTTFAAATATGELTITHGTGGGGAGGLEGTDRWRVYRKLGTTFLKLADIAYPTLSYADRGTVALDTNTVCPTSGQNDKPASNSFGVIWKDRLALNDAITPTQIQLSNLFGPTQFASFDATADDQGVRIPVATDGGDIVSGLSTIGSELVVLKTRKIGVMVGDSPTGTVTPAFTYREVADAECISSTNVCKCNDKVSFRGNDGIYMIGGDLTPVKISTPVQDLFQAFHDPYSPSRNIAEDQIAEEPYTNPSSSITGGTSHSFFFDDVLYVTLADRTLGYDTLAHGWFDTGLGRVSTAGTHYAGGNVPATAVIVTKEGIASPLGVTVKAFSTTDRYDDRKAPTKVNQYEDCRPFDGAGVVRQRVKGMHQVTLFGRTSAQPGDYIGTMTVECDNGFTGVYSIKAFQWLQRKDALYQFRFPPMAKGREIKVRFTWTYPDVDVFARLWEYTLVL